MRVLLVAENQAAAVRVDRGQVDAVTAQQRQQQVRTDVTEVAGNDAVKSRGSLLNPPAVRKRVSAAAGEDVIFGIMCLMRSDHARGYTPARLKRPKNLNLHRDFSALMHINHVNQFDYDFARQAGQIAIFYEL